MKVGWVADKHDPPGGAELTQAEFRAAVPESVEVIDCAPALIRGHKGPFNPNNANGCDLFVAHNHVTYPPTDWNRPVVRYHHDMRPQHIAGDISIYCSPLQRERLKGDGPTVPPPIDLAAFKPTRQQRRNTERKGTCCVGAFMNPGKGGYRVATWADENEPVDVYGFGPFLPEGPNINYCGPLEQAQVAQTLWKYERFVFLPVDLEPFGRCVVEAWAAGCDLVINGNVGARYWLEENPEALETASADFWAVVLDA